MWPRQEHYPDLLLGTEAWDGVLKVMMSRSGFEPRAPVVYHEVHAAYWSRNLLSSPAQIHNRKLAAEWIRRHGAVDFLCRG